MPDPIISPDGKRMWTGSEWIPVTTSPSQISNFNLQDSVVGGDVNISMNNITEIQQAVGHALNHQFQPIATNNAPRVESPRKQVWFMGRRVWSPKGFFLLISLFLNIFSLGMLTPLPALSGAFVAGYCAKNGDIRGIPVLLINLLIVAILI
tara:strand:+ start:214 stop:666 length:453 start_codon:yes stop_codon:yes gene_type:complete